jgi:hypothetical protein
MESGAPTASRFALPRGRAVARVLASPQVVVGVIVLAAFLAALPYTRRVAEYYVMPDELGYVKQALDIVRSKSLVTTTDFYFGSYSQLQPLLMAPAYALFDGLRAFDAAHAINAAAQASTAIPAYLLARRVLPWRPAAYLVALLTVITPWAVMSGSMMSENAAYPASVWGALAVQRAIAEPGVRADLLAVLGVGLAFFARSQFYLLGIAFVAAVVLHEVGYRLAEARAGERLAALRAGVVATVRGHVALVVVGVLVLLALLVTSVGNTALGTYASVQNGQLLPPGTLDKGLELVENVVIAVACLPLVLTLAWVPLTLLRPRTRDQHAFAALLLFYLPLLVVALGSFSVRFTAGPNDRYMFYILPLLFVGMMAMLLDRRPNRVAILVGAGLTAWLAWTASFQLTGPSMVAASSAFHAVLLGHAVELGKTVGIHQLRAQSVIAVATVVAAVVLIAVRPRLRPALVAGVVAVLVGSFTLVETVYTAKKVTDGQATVPNSAVDQRAWIDKAIGRDGRAATVISLIADVQTTDAVLWETSFWNETVRNTFVLQGGSGYDVGAAAAFTFRPDGSISGMDGYRHLAISTLDRRFALRGTRVEARRDPMVLYRVPARPQADWSMQATDDSGLTPAGRTTIVRVYGSGSAPVRRRLALAFVPSFQAPQGYRYRIDFGGRSTQGYASPKGATVRTVTVTAPPHGSAQVRFTTLRPRQAKPGPFNAGIVVLGVLTTPRAIASARRSARHG